MLNIITAPNSILSQNAKPVAKIDSAILSLIEEMSKALLLAKDPEGVGLAAPQVGKSLQIFIIKQTRESPILTFINPMIEEFLNAPSEIKQQAIQSEKTAMAKEKSGIDKNVQLEGCLSLKDIWGEVKRHSSIVLSYQDEKGQRHRRKFQGLIATIIQHEIDHLNGILFPKRVLEQKGKLYKSHRNEKGEDVFEEIEL